MFFVVCYCISVLNSSVSPQDLPMSIRPRQLQSMARRLDPIPTWPIYPPFKRHKSSSDPRPDLSPQDRLARLQASAAYFLKMKSKERSRSRSTATRPTGDASNSQRIVPRTPSFVASNPTPAPAPAPSLTPTSRPMHKFTPDEVIRLSAKYSRLRNITNFEKLEKAFLKQRAFEDSKKKKSPSRKDVIEMSDKNDWKTWQGKRGVPIVSKVPLSPELTKMEETASTVPKSPDPAWDHSFEHASTRMFRSLRLTNPRQPPSERNPSPLLRVRFTTTFNEEGPTSNYKAPPLEITKATQPLIPRSYYPSQSVYSSKPLFLMRLIHPKPFDLSQPSAVPKNIRMDDASSEAIALNHRRTVETSPRYLKEIESLLALPHNNDPEIRTLVMREIERRRIKLDYRRGIELKKVPSKAWPEGTRCLSLGLFIPVGKKMVHALASIRNNVKRKLRNALAIALVQEWESSSEEVRNELRFNGWSAIIQPTPHVKLARMEDLVRHMRSALSRISKNYYIRGWQDREANRVEMVETDKSSGRRTTEASQRSVNYSRERTPKNPRNDERRHKNTSKRTCQSS